MLAGRRAGGKRKGREEMMNAYGLRKIMRAVTAVFALVLATAGLTQAADGMRWVGTWASSVQEVEAGLMPDNYQDLNDTTIRQVVRVSIGGSQARIRLSNAFGGNGDLRIDSISMALSTGGNGIDEASAKTITFHGEPAVVIPGGTMMVSDPVDFDVKPGTDLVVSLHVQNATRRVSGHRSARGPATFFLSGNHAAEKELPDSTVNNCWYYLGGVDVLVPEKGAAILCLGDSITDGKGSTEGENRRWPDMLARRLLADEAYAHIGVLNQGIGGNNLWRGGLGQPVMQRMERDVLGQPSIKWLIVLEGINDLGGSRAQADDLIRVYEQIIIRAHDRGLKVYGSTVLPCGESFYFRPGVEEQRQKVNEWIRTCGLFDAVIDWDAVVRDPENPANLLPAADSGDHLHLSDAGYQMMVDALDLSLFKD